MTSRQSLLVGALSAVVTLGVGIAVGTVLLLATTYHVYEIPSTSMQPTLPLGSYALSKNGGSPQDGDLVVFRAPTWGAPGGAGPYVKRVIGSGGETVSSGTDGIVVRDGKSLEEPYADISADEDVSARFGPVTVPEGRYWLLGDNRPNSADSRFHVFDPFHGTVARSDVTGIVVAHGSAAAMYRHVAVRAAALAAVLSVLVGVVVTSGLRRRARRAVPGPDWTAGRTMEGP